MGRERDARLRLAYAADFAPLQGYAPLRLDRHARPQTDALRGSLDLLVLKALSLGPMHGWGICRRIEQVSGGMLEVKQGSVYPALQRMQRHGLINSDWGTTANNRQARCDHITTSGRRALKAELERWRRFSIGLEAVLPTVEP